MKHHKKTSKQHTTTNNKQTTIQQQTNNQTNTNKQQTTTKDDKRQQHATNKQQRPSVPRTPWCAHGLYSTRKNRYLLQQQWCHPGGVRARPGKGREGRRGGEIRTSRCLSCDLSALCREVWRQDLEATTERCFCSAEKAKKGARSYEFFVAFCQLFLLSGREHTPAPSACSAARTPSYGHSLLENPHRRAKHVRSATMKISSPDLPSQSASHSIC